MSEKETTIEIILQIMKAADRNFERLQSKIDKLIQENNKFLEVDVQRTKEVNDNFETMNRNFERIEKRLSDLEDNAHCPNEACEIIRKEKINDD